MLKSALVATTTAAVTGVGLGFAVPAQASVDRVVGHVYEPTNDAGGNTVAVFDRYADGSLKPAGQVATGGLGTGASLASQGGIARDGKLLFVVNAGDGTISSLSTSGRAVQLRDTLSSRGDLPVSLTVHDGVGYVLNHDSDTISGFRYDRSGDLHRLRASTRRLTPNPAGGLTDAAEVAFSPHGKALVVTERATNNIDTFVVRSRQAYRAEAHPSAGAVPYGFDFGRRGTLLVSEAATSSASSYRVLPRLRTITAALTDTQAAACWLVASGNVAWVINAASDSISRYHVGGGGGLELVDAVAAVTAAGPTDAAVAPHGHNLYVRTGDGSVSSFHITANGSLVAVDSAFVTTTSGPAGLVTD